MLGGMPAPTGWGGVPAPGGGLVPGGGACSPMGGVSARGGVCSQGGACSRGVPARGGGGPGGDLPDGYCCGRYASYWNAFLRK